MYYNDSIIKYIKGDHSMRKVVPLKKQYEIMDNSLKVRVNTNIPEIMK